MALRIGDLTNAASFVGTAEFELALTGSAGSRKVTGANLRTQLLAGGSGFVAADPLVVGNATVAGYVEFSLDVAFGAGATHPRIHQNAEHGLLLQTVAGSTNDFLLATNAGSAIASVPTGTTTFAIGGLLRVTFTTQQLSLRYDASNHLAVTVASNGAVTYDATGAGATHIFSEFIQCSASIIATGGMSVISSSTGMRVFAGAAGTAGIEMHAESAGDHFIDCRTSGGGAGTGDFILKAAQLHFNAGTPFARPDYAAASGSASRATFDTTTVTTAELAQRVKAMIDDFISFGIFV